MSKKVLSTASVSGIIDTLFKPKTMNENKTLSAELIEFCEAHKIDTKYAGFLMGLFSKHNALSQNENKSVEELTAKNFMIQKNEEFKSSHDGEDINPIYLNNRHLERFMEEFADLKHTTLQQSNALLKAEMESWKTEHFETVEMAAEKITGLEQANAELKQELSDKDTAYILTKNTLIRRTKKLKELEKQNEELIDVLKIISKWELPETGRFWDDEATQPMSYEAAYGSSGVRDYFKELALNAVQSHESNKQP